MSKGLKTILGIVAAIAIPFAAPVIAGAIGVSGAVGGLLGSTALGASVGSGLVGAGLGAGAAALTGQNPLLGAALGGFGGFASGGGFSSLFGSGAGAADLPAVGAAEIGSGATGAGGSSFMVPGPNGMIPVASPVGATPLVVEAPISAATTTSGILGTIKSFGINPNTIAQLGLTMFNKPPSGLTAAELAAVRETAGLAAQDENLFKQRVEQARAMLNAATPNPEQAFATTAMQVERQALEATRGGTEFDERRAALDRQRLGAGAVAQEAARANQARVAGLQALPGQAPAGVATRTLPIYAAAQRREDQFDEQLSRAIGGGGLYGSRGLFG